MVSKYFLNLYYRHCPFAKASKTKFIAQKEAYHSNMVRPKPLSHLPSSFSQPHKFFLQAFHAFRTPSLISTILSISAFSATQIFPASHARQIAMPRNTKHPKGRSTAPSSPPPNPSDRNDTSTIYFYTPTSHPYAFLCQMYPCSFTSPQKHPGVIFTSAEQYMMYCKALVFSRPDVAKSILKLECPPEQKYLARGIKPSTAEHKEWQKVKYGKNDRTWGVGFDEATAEENRVLWGQNLLGKALMEVREKIRDDESMRRDGEENVEKMEERGRIHNGRK